MQGQIRVKARPATQAEVGSPREAIRGSLKSQRLKLFGECENFLPKVVKHDPMAPRTTLRYPTKGRAWQWVACQQVRGLIRQKTKRKFQVDSRRYSELNQFVHVNVSCCSKRQPPLPWESNALILIDSSGPPYCRPPWTQRINLRIDPTCQLNNEACVLT